MKNYYCPKCKIELDESMIKAVPIKSIEDDGHGSPTFYNTFSRHCVKCNALVEEKFVK